MNSIKSILGMIATEAREGGSRDHYFDEFRNKDFINDESQERKPSDLSTATYNLESRIYRSGRPEEEK